MFNFCANLIHKHLGMKIKTQYPQKVNVWDRNYGRLYHQPFFLTENLTSNPYFTILQDAIDQIITQVIENFINFLGDQIISKENIVLERDSCPTN